MFPSQERFRASSFTQVLTTWQLFIDGWVDEWTDGPLDEGKRHTCDKAGRQDYTSFWKIHRPFLSMVNLMKRQRHMSYFSELSHATTTLPYLFIHSLAFLLTLSSHLDTTTVWTEYKSVVVRKCILRLSIHPFSFPYLGSDCSGNGPSKVFRTSLLHRGSQGVPRPDEICNPSSEIYVYPGVSSQLDGPGMTREGVTHEAFGSYDQGICRCPRWNMDAWCASNIHPWVGVKGFSSQHHMSVTELHSASKV